jgi:hypothetical protein
MNRSTDRPLGVRQRRTRGAIALCVMLYSISALSAGTLTLKPETVKAWDQYVHTVNDKMTARLAPSRQFLWIDETAERRASVRGGEIVVMPATPQTPRKVPSGLIHHWIGGSFIPDTTLDEVLGVVSDYPRYKDHYKPAVIASKTLSLGPVEDRYSVMLMNKSLFSKTALDGDYKSSTFRLSPRRAYGTTQSTRLQEIEDYGTASPRTLPTDQGGGLIWRLFSLTRYEEREGGVYVEVEAMALSREIPFALRWFADPVVRRVSRSSLSTSIQQTKDALHSEAVLARRNVVSPRAAPVSSGPSSPSFAKPR